MVDFPLDSPVPDNLLHPDEDDEGENEEGMEDSTSGNILGDEMDNDNEADAILTQQSRSSSTGCTPSPIKEVDIHKTSSSASPAELSRGWVSDGPGSSRLRGCLVKLQPQCSKPVHLGKKQGEEFNLYLPHKPTPPSAILPSWFSSCTREKRPHSTQGAEKPLLLHSGGIME
ncbi:hypothetical protein SKAU_G00068100 [Synaphobranchus kaupii]|uniref:Uncharacterized protein n=1 Tax=Synaphobranchus kaupii TaxID=118154 RepID=A0A9Q1JBF4_SYNKA|nr:hypothetical protein SKAU_G00068100 [Synaphobranchus kaupii]